MYWKLVFSHHRILISSTMFKFICCLFISLYNLLFFLDVKVLRDGRWSEQDAAVLVPGDIVSIKLGDIIPADARLLDGDPLKIDQVGLWITQFLSSLEKNL